MTDAHRAMHRASAATKDCGTRSPRFEPGTYMREKSAEANETQMDTETHLSALLAFYSEIGLGFLRYFYAYPDPKAYAGAPDSKR